MSIDNHHTPLRRWEVVRISIASAVAIAALVYVVSNLDETASGAISRLAAAVSLILIFQWLSERRLNRKFERLGQEAERRAYWKAYAAALNDLSGIGGDASGEHSGDIYGGRRR